MQQKIWIFQLKYIIVTNGVSPFILLIQREGLFMKRIGKQPSGEYTTADPLKHNYSLSLTPRGKPREMLKRICRIWQQSGQHEFGLFSGDRPFINIGDKIWPIQFPRK